MTSIDSASAVRSINTENVVASAAIGQEIDLIKLEEDLEGGEYDPDQFPGLVYRTEDPIAALLLFRSGKIVCTGSKSIDDIHKSLWIFLEELRKLGIPVEEDIPISVQNLVASADLGCRFNLTEVALGLGLEDIEYDPDEFPGLVYRLDGPNVIILVFSSGKIVVTGAKGSKDVQIAVSDTARLLRGFGHPREDDTEERTQSEASPNGSDYSYDVFISHASEDKEQVVRPLANELEKRNLDVWYDEHELSIGDSLREEIDTGLGESRYGIVVLSEHFFEKEWTQYELNGLVSRHMEEDKVILPLWLDVDKKDVVEESPVLADLLAESIDPEEIEGVAEKIEREVKSN